jgi:hypothetical protein
MIPDVLSLIFVDSGKLFARFASPSAEDRLPKSLRFAESDVIILL